MADDPLWLRALERLGVNVTRLRWRLYQMDQKRGQEKRLLPDSLRWLEYQHIICAHCGAIIPRGDRVCPQCERRAPTLLGYRLYRLAGLAFPEKAPVVTSAFLGASIFFFALTILIDGPSAIMKPSSETLLRLGAFLAMEGIPWTELWRGLAFGVLHFGLFHIGFNGFALFQIGPVIEAEIGARKMLVLVTATQIGAAVATYVWYALIQKDVAFTAGASGWLFGLIGFGAGFFHSQGSAGRMQRNFFLQWAAYVFIFGMLLGANNAAHLGGFLVGLPLGTILFRQRYPSSQQQSVWNALFAVSLLLWVGTAVTVAITALGNQ